MWSEQFERFKADIRQQYARQRRSREDGNGDAQETTAAYALNGANAADETPSGFIVTIPLNSLPTAEVTLYSEDSESHARQAVEEIYTARLPIIAASLSPRCCRRSRRSAN